MTFSWRNSYNAIPRHCFQEFFNAVALANGALRSVRSSALDLKDVSPGEVSTLTLALPNSNSETLPNTPDVGEYVLACWLPRVRQDAHGEQKFETKLIHYAVGMVD